MTGDERYPDGIGFVWGETESIVWLAGPEDGYKKIDPALLKLLRAIAADDRQFGELDERAREAILHLETAGYVQPGGDVVHYETPAAVTLWPRFVVFAVGFLALAGFVVGRLLGLFPPAPLGPGGVVERTAIGIVLLTVLAIAHEAGHYYAAKPYFEPTLSLSLLNGVFPAVVTETNDAWRCPRSVRIWISLAGPLVDVVCTLVLVAIHLTVVPTLGVLGVVVTVEFLRLLFSLNPFVQGDGYWMLVDWTGQVNLQKRGLDDLRAGEITTHAVFASASILVTLAGVVLVGRFVYLIVTSFV